MTLTMGTRIKLPSMAMAPATMEDPNNGTKIFKTVMPTPKIKLIQTAALVTRFQYKPYMKGAKKAPAKAPQEIPISCAMKVGGLRAKITERTMKKMIKPLMQSIFLFSLIFLTTAPLIKSRVKVELEVKTKDAKVDMEAESTKTITMPIMISGVLESMKGMIPS